MTIYFIYFLSILLPLLIGNQIISLCKNIGLKQSFREEGPKKHISEKANTPTLGGLIFLIPVFLITLGLIVFFPCLKKLDLIFVFLVTFSMATLGFVDDFLKIREKKNKGLSGKFRLFIQFIFSVIFFLIYKEGESEGLSLVFSVLWIFFVFSGACNSYNLTDGLDGLATKVSIASFLGLIVLCFLKGNTELGIFSTIFLGSLLGFLYFNKYPAKIFMGDTGSIAIGSSVGLIALILKSELMLAFFASIPVIETLSVISQVTYFKITKRLTGEGKRIFKMTPLHHHFELIGWNEEKVVNRFFLFQLFCTLIGISLILA